MKKVIMAITVFVILLYCNLANAQNIPYDKQAEAWLARQKSICERLGELHCKMEDAPFAWVRGRVLMEKPEQRKNWISACVKNSPCLWTCEYDKLCNFATESKVSYCRAECQAEFAEYQKNYKKTQDYAEERKADRKLMQEAAAIQAKLNAERAAEEKRKQEALAEQARQSAQKRAQIKQTLIANIKASKKYNCIVACVKDKLSKELCQFDGQTPQPVPPIFIASGGELSKNNFEQSPNARLCMDICKTIGE
ncbi:MAG: hypothetical protein IKY83_00400 [Proteobacteria bacterium]|nr:hypothetical protein [Pseudomonadota bacterium]